MNMPVDVIATFNTKGNIRIDYILLEDDKHEIHRYRINNIEYTKEENLAGYRSILFVCYILKEEIREQIKVKFIVDTHKFIFVN